MLTEQPVTSTAIPRPEVMSVRERSAGTRLATITTPRAATDPSAATPMNVSATTTRRARRVL